MINVLRCLYRWAFVLVLMAGLKLKGAILPNKPNWMPLQFAILFWQLQAVFGLMIVASLSSTIANRIADYVCRAVTPTALTSPVQVSLHTASPGTTGASEAAGGSYARQNAGYSAASGGACALAATLSFIVQAATYTHMGLWDSAPIFLQGAALASSVVIGSNGQTIQLTAATNTVTGTG